LEIDNIDLSDAYFSKTNTVKKYVIISAMVRYEDFEVHPTEPSSTGANTGISGSFEHSGFCTTNSWTKLEYECFSGNETKLNLGNNSTDFEN